MNVFPTKFEAYESESPIFSVEAFDEATATVKIDSVVDVALWDEIAPLIRKCLVDMRLGVTESQEV